VLRAAPGHRVELGDKATVQDNIVVRALNESVTIGDESNLGHHAIVRDSQIGDSAYIGYNTEIEDSRVGTGPSSTTAPGSRGWRYPTTPTWRRGRS
jgi:carbonic anhydrase/acetyltransferase-like protein (isoleucine patch superfamily)